MTDEKQKEIDRIAGIIRERIAKKEPLPIIKGAFGEVDGCEGIVERFIDEDHGLKCKFYGCPFLYKGYPEHKSVDSLGLVKALVTKFAEETIGRSRFVKIGIVLFALLDRKHFIHSLRVFTYLVRIMVLRKLFYVSMKKFCFPIQHLLMTAREVARKQWDVDPDSKMMLEEYKDYIGKREIPMIILGALDFAAMILEYDNAYRFRMQDIIAELNKDNVEKDVRAEVKRLFGLLIEREYGTEMKNKWKQIGRLLDVVLRFSKDFRRFLQGLLLSLDIGTMAMDESDHYFSLNRPSYNHKGVPYKDRLALQKKIEQDLGIIRFSMQATNAPPLGSPTATTKCSKNHTTANADCETLGCTYTKINHVHICEECGFSTKVNKKDVVSP